MRRTSICRAFAVLIAAGVLTAGCAQESVSPEEIAELKTQQKQILAKLDTIDKKLDKAPAAAPPPKRRTGPDPGKKYELPVGNSDVKGPKDGAITITEFSDYQCPFCARAEPIINEALDAYPTQARFVYKNFPLTSIHQNAMGAAQAALAARMQGKFWEMHELLFKNQRALQAEKLSEYAKQLGLDVAKFESDMKSDAVKKEIRADMRLAQNVGVRGTPTIFVNGKLLRNRSIQGFKDIIDPILKTKAKG